MNISTTGIILILSLASSTGWSTEKYEELTVTAHRLPVASVPQIKVIEQADIEHRASSVGPDILAELPGLAISRSGAFGGNAQIRVRGAEANHLQVLIDGIKVNDPAIGSEFDFAHLNLAGVNRIEYLPGAQSALWGSDAIAGVLNFVTAPAGKRREIAVTGGSFQTRQARLEFADRAESGYYGFAANVYDTNGTNHSLTGSEEDGYQNQTLHFNGGLSRDNIGAQLVLRFTDSKSDTDPAPFPISVPIDGDDRTELTQFAGKAELNADFLDGRWLQVLALSFLKTENVNRSDGLITNTVDGKRLTVSLRQHFLVNSQQTLTAIVEREVEKFNQTGAPSFFGDPNQRQEGRTDSLSVEHIGRWGNLDTAISARIDRNRDFENAFSYRLTARYRLTPEWQTVAAYGTGLKNPNFVERFGFAPDTFIGNPGLEPEENRHISMGLIFNRGATEIQLTYFNDQLNNEIDGFVATTTPGIFTAENLTGESDREGVEMLASTQMAGFSLSAGYSYLHARDPQGVEEIRRPKHTGHLRVGREFAHDRGYFQIGSIFTGEQLDTDFRTFVPVTLKGYCRAYASAFYQLTDHLTIATRVENALDDNTADVFMFRPPERAFYLTLEAKL